jgi:hypothetical protein
MILNDISGTPAAPRPARAPAPLAKSWMPTEAERRVLEASNWSLPERPAVAPVDTSMLDLTQSRQLNSHTYTLSPNQWKQLTSTARKYYPQQEGQEVAGVRAATTPMLQSAPMTQEAYDALDDEQKQAVQFNTLLVEARQQDLTAQQKPQNRDSYDEAVRKMFGDTGGSDTYAPNTVQLLEKIGYTSKASDLDDFLSMDAAVSLSELKNFKLPPLPVIKAIEPLEQTWLGNPASRIPLPTDTYEKVRSQSNLDTAYGLAIRSAGQKIAATLKDNQLWSPTASLNSVMGLPVGDVPFGFARGPYADVRKTAEDQRKEAIFQQAYESLMNPKSTLESFAAAVQEEKLSDKEIEELFSYLDAQSRNDEALGIVRSGQRTPKQFREFLGLKD